MKNIFSYFKKLIPYISRWDCLPNTKSILYSKLYDLISPLIESHGIKDQNHLKKYFDKHPNELQSFLEKAKVLEEKMYQDLQHARQRDVLIQSVKGSNTRANISITIISIILVLCTLFLIFNTKKLDPWVSNVISLVMALSVSCIRDFFNFEFGGCSKNMSELKNSLNIDYNAIEKEKGE